MNKYRKRSCLSINDPEFRAQFSAIYAISVKLKYEMKLLALPTESSRVVVVVVVVVVVIVVVISPRSVQK